MKLLGSASTNPFRAGKTNKDNRCATKETVSIVIVRFFVIRMAILSYFHWQNPGYLQRKRCATKETVSIFIVRFFVIRMAILSYFHRQTLVTCKGNFSAT